MGRTLKKEEKSGADFMTALRKSKMELKDIFSSSYWEQFWNNLKTSFKAGSEKVGNEIENTAKGIENGMKDGINAVYDNVVSPIGEATLKEPIETGVEIVTGQSIDTLRENENGLQDKTNENIESSINGASVYDWLEEQQAKQWEREDTAFTRMVQDMQRAGINPNLYNASPVSDSGNIIGAGVSANSTEVDKYLKELQIAIDKAFEGDQNEKDRINELIGKAIQTVATYLIFKK